MRTHVPFAEAPVTISSKRSPTRDSSSSAAADFRTWRSTLVALFSCSVQCRANSPSSPLRVRRRCPSKRGLQQALRDQVREATVWRRRMSVIPDREPKVSRHR